MRRSGPYAPGTFGVFYVDGYRRNVPERYPGFDLVHVDGKFVTTRFPVR